ncbi:uncharacterized protein CTRU02_203649 [Colletotrichum truncatum]|uniref:Uncharacterized protein n=1 Tax=Colletotrichum truncatum TaxID=5467 RepID=A0ACC3Z9Y9_COLTU
MSKLGLGWTLLRFSHPLIRGRETTGWNPVAATGRLRKRERERERERGGGGGRLSKHTTSTTTANDSWASFFEATEVHSACFRRY